MKYRIFLAMASALSMAIPAAAQMVPPSKWLPAGYTLVKLATAKTPDEINTSFQILKSAGLENAFDGAEAIHPNPGSGVYAAQIGNLIIAQVDSRNTCTANECTWLILRDWKLIKRVDACSVTDYVAISSDNKQLRICDTKITLD